MLIFDSIGFFSIPAVQIAFKIISLFVLGLGCSVPFFIIIYSAMTNSNSTFFRMVGMFHLFLLILNGYLGCIYLNVQQVDQFQILFAAAIISCVGPVCWLGLKAYVDKTFTYTNKHLYLFLPSLIISVVGIANVFVDAKKPIIYLELESLNGFCLLVSGAYSLIYGLFNNKIYWSNQMRFSESSDDEKARHIFLCVLAVALGLQATSVYFVLLFDILSPLVPLLVTSVFYSVGFVLFLRNPKLINLLTGEDFLENKRKSSALQKTTTVKIEKRLVELMDREKVYLDADISLPRLAELIEVSTHQLSEYLNAHLKLSFTQYMKRLRVQEAKFQLLANSKEPILNVAFDSGFKSKSTFNAAFSEIVGCTPTAWRKGNSL